MHQQIQEAERSAGLTRRGLQSRLLPAAECARPPAAAAGARRGRPSVRLRVRRWRGALRAGSAGVRSRSRI